MILSFFSWGYWGWGNATSQVVKAFDLAEQVRGFEPPIFVDCRLRRQGRAKGFVGGAFENLVGQNRYRWMQDLGNEEIATGGKGVRIRNPGAIDELVDLALRAADQNRRVIFYCACEYPRLDGELSCHRLTIADLLLKHAARIQLRLSVVEWPGDEPREIRLEVDRRLFAPLMAGRRKSVAINDEQLKEFASLPWGSLATIQPEGRDETGTLVVGPARFAASNQGKSGWYLPVIETPGPIALKESLLKSAAQWRSARGLDLRESR